MPRQAGFTYIAVLLAMLLLALSTQGVMTYVSQQAQRDRETELLRIGYAYAQAIGAYYEATPGSVKRWPRQLDDLIEDRRLVSIRRYLRELYPDPVTRLPNWELVNAPDGGIAGVRSRSEAAPLRDSAIELDGVTLTPATRYSDWQFVYQPAPLASPSTGKVAPNQ
jgi:type II secretory pathway pseudopilin PulG